MIPSQTLPEPVSDLKFDPKSAIYVPLGAASPFWFLYAGAASAGVAYWWLSRWREATNLEALFVSPPSVLESPGQSVLEAAPAAEPDVGIPEASAVTEPEPEPAFVAAAELAAEPVAEPEPGIETAAEPAAAKPKPSRGARPIVDDIGPA